jgi:low affinity Fe/Cu permease
MKRLNALLERFSHFATVWAGTSWAFAAAVAVLLVWACTGPLFGFSETWQLVVNTGTTIVTFLMVFLIQRSQNKESLAVQVKLNELLAAQKGASNRLINAEDMSEEEIKQLHKRFAQLSKRLEDAQDDCSPHSVKEAIHAAHASLTKADQPRSGNGNGRTNPPPQDVPPRISKG